MFKKTAEKYLYLCNLTIDKADFIRTLMARSVHRIRYFRNNNIVWSIKHDSKADRCY